MKKGHKKLSKKKLAVNEDAGKLHFVIIIAAIIAASVLATGYYEPHYRTGSPGYCVAASDCVPAQCCHPTGCTDRANAPDCSDAMCTQECVPGTMDCGQGSCSCINNECVAVIG